MRGSSRLLAMIVGAILLSTGFASSTAAQQTKEYKYDALGRLIEVKRNDASGDQQQAKYTYDTAGNRVSFDSTGSATSPNPSPAIQLRPVYNGRFFVMQRLPVS